MITKLLAVVLLFSSTQAFAFIDCKQQEAQFSGTVKSLPSFIDPDRQGCYIQIEFEGYQHSQVCPLMIEEVMNTEVYATTCPQQVGENISGYLVKKNNHIWID